MNIFMSLINLLKWVIYKQKYPCSQPAPQYISAIYFLIVQNVQFGRTMRDKPEKFFLADYKFFFKSGLHSFFFFFDLC